MLKRAILILTILTLSLSSVIVFADEPVLNSLTPMNLSEVSEKSIVVQPNYMYTTVIDKKLTRYKVWKQSGERDFLSTDTYYKELRFQNNYEFDYIDSYAYNEEDTPYYTIEVWYDVYHYVTW